MVRKTDTLLQKISFFLFFGLLAYMPLHIFLSTWLGTSFGVLEVARIAKEIVLAIGAGLALAVGLRRGVVQKLLQDKIIWLITAFVALNVLFAQVVVTDLDAEVLGVIYNVRFLIMFVWAMILVRLYKPKRLIKTAVKVVLTVGLLVVIFGLFQYLFLPDDALRHLGYDRTNGVLPAFFIDDKPDLERIMSTIRDPNSLGSYLLIILGFSSVWALSVEGGKRKVRYMVFAALTLLAIFWTFSRAAWIGAVATIVVIGFFVAVRQRFRVKTYKVPILIASVLLLILGATGLYAFRDTYLVQNVVFHADEATVLEDPNELRLRFWQESFEDIANEPLGSGPGTAGLASIRNDERTVLNENYYFQTAQETGVIGLVLFVAILLIAAVRLYSRARTQDLVAIALLASLAGLMITNFLAHIWANEAVAYTWWGLAGLVVFRPASKKKIT